MNVYAYVRVSSLSQSYERQIEEIKTYCLHKGYKIVRIFKEIVSGMKNLSEREQMELMLRVLKEDKGEVQCVVCYELSRIGRRAKEMLDIIEAIEKAGKWVEFVQEGVTTRMQKGVEFPLGRLLITILSGFSQLEREMIVERTISGLKGSVSNGNWVGGKIIPYGYKRENKKLVIDDEESVIIRLIFSKYLSGMGTKVIADELNNKKIPTRYQKSLGKINFTWKDGTIYGILTNPTYIGKKIGKGRIKDIELNSPQIISEEDFQNVQNLLKSKNRRSDKKYTYVLQDKVKCGVCGLTYHPHKRASGKDNRYICLSRRYGKDCKNIGISIPKLERAIWDTLRNNENVLKSIYRYNNNKQEIEDKLEKCNELINDLQKNIERNFEKKEKLLEVYLNEIIDQKQYESEQKKLVSLDTQLIGEMEYTKGQIIELNNVLKKQNNISRILRGIKDDRGSFRRMVNQIINVIKIYPVDAKCMKLIFESVNGQDKFVFVKIYTFNYEEPLCFIIGQRNNQIVFCFDEEYDIKDAKFSVKRRRTTHIFKDLVVLPFNLDKSRI